MTVVLELQEAVYAFGVDIIIILQEKCAFLGNYFSLVNKWSNPDTILSFIFPAICTIDSVFAAELLLSLSVGGWLNSILKWLFQEDRPFWWIKETSYYRILRIEPPQLRLTSQTCETGSGSSSTHSTAAVSMALLLVTWITTIVAKKTGKYPKWLNIFLESIVLFVTIGVTLSQIFVAAHFPHQSFLGCAFGVLMAKLIPSPIMKPVINYDEEYSKLVKAKGYTDVVYGSFYRKRLFRRVIRNIASCFVAMGIAFATYWGLKYFGYDPLWSVKLAFKRCPSPDFLHYTSTPQFALVRDVSSLMGLAICLTPSIKSYRYDTYPRSFAAAIVSAFMFHQLFSQWQDSISKDDSTTYYLTIFASNILRTIFFLRVVPMLATCTNRFRRVPNPPPAAPTSTVSGKDKKTK